jgi:hypothetical protein
MNEKSTEQKKQSKLTEKRVREIAREEIKKWREDVRVPLDSK